MCALLGPDNLRAGALEGTTNCKGRGGRMAQLSDRRTEQTGAGSIPSRGGGRDLSPGVNFQRRLCERLSYKPTRCALACVSVCTHVKNKSPALAVVPLFGRTTVLHALIAVGSAALAAAVPLAR